MQPQPVLLIDNHLWQGREGDLSCRGCVGGIVSLTHEEGEIQHTKTYGDHHQEGVDLGCCGFECSEVWAQTHSHYLHVS